MKFFFFPQDFEVTSHDNEIIIMWKYAGTSVGGDAFIHTYTHTCADMVTATSLDPRT